MKKRNLLIISLLFCGIITIQAQTFKKGDLVGDLTIGLGSTLYTGVGYTSSIPPLAIAADYGIVDNVFDKGTIGIGGLIGYSSAGWSNNSYGYNYGWNYTYIVIGPRGTLHYPFIDKLDTYAGLLVGYNIVSVSATGTAGTYGSAAGSAAIFAFFVGARYYFTDKFAVMAELGTGFAYLNLGISLKLK